MIDLDENAEPEMTPEEIQAKLNQAFKENDEPTCLEYLNKDANPLKEDKDGWTPLQWAAFHGNEKLVKILLREHQAATPYLKDSEDVKVVVENDEDNDPFKKPKIASEEGKYTPMHWASYKGFH